MALTAKQKRHAVSQGKKWVNFKLKAEAPFKRELSSYFAAQRKRVARGLDPETIESVLEKQYRRIVRNMTGIRLKQEEDDFGLENKINLFLAGLALEHARLIDKTTKKLLRRSIELARQELMDQGIAFPSAATIDKVTANIFSAYNRNRVGTIAVSETQHVTEGIKSIVREVADDMMEAAIVEINTELGMSAAELNGGINAREVAENIGKKPNSELFAMMASAEKTWVTMGDSKVRDAHQAAAFQTVPINQPFEVGGELLMYPGDTSMGASMENVANCRCSSVNL